ncbi:MAG: type toxin-antitoxin system HipA family toxin [Gammaproteobacteria bacterium]|nr:type toxin-antitoxin system HipA family toxin [Gammaproteobacteria bacterium]
MKRCPITYEEIGNDRQYSKRGLRLLSPKLENLLPLPFTAQEQRNEAMARAGKMSIQGVQTKLSALLRVKEQCFEIVDNNGLYILKTQSSLYPEIPENEALTMSLAATIGLDVPVHGLVYAKDNSMTYFIKRFDRLPRNKKIAVEDFAQLSGFDRDTKYGSSMEQVAEIVSKFCTYPKIEFVKLLKLTLFNFLIGNEDMHLKNFSLISKNNIITLSPVYDLLNSTIAINQSIEEMALPIKGRKNNITRNNFLDYYGKQRLKLNEKIIDEIVKSIQVKLPLWHEMIENSFLSEKMKKSYLALLKKRQNQLCL